MNSRAESQLRRDLKRSSSLGILLALVAAGAGFSAEAQPTVAPAGLRFGAVLTTNVGTATSHINDKVEARVVRPVSVNGHPVLPAGTVLSGRVLMVRLGDSYNRTLPTLKLGFDKLTLPDGRTFPVSASIVGLKYILDSQTITVVENGQVQPENPDEKARDVKEGLNSGPTPGSWGAAIGGGFIKGAIAGGAAIHQYANFTLKKGRGATLLLNSDLVFAGQGQSNPPLARLTPESGTTSGNSYRNEFIGFSYPFPQGWRVQGLEAQKQVALRGHKAAFGENSIRSPAELGVEHSVAMERTRFLFGATQAPGKEMTIPSVQIIAFDISGGASVPDLKTMLTDLSRGLTSKGAALIRPVAEKKIAAREFAVALFKFEAKDSGSTTQTWFEGMALTYDRNYALLWIFDANDQPGVENLLGSLNGLSFSGGFRDQGIFLVYRKPRNPFTILWPGLHNTLGAKYTDLLSTVTFKATPDGSYESQSLCTNHGTTETRIVSDGAEGWSSITVKWTPSEEASSEDFAPPPYQWEFIRQGPKVQMTGIKGHKTGPTITLSATGQDRPLLINWSEECSWNPGLLGELIPLYDQSRGGEQDFNFFNFVPSYIDEDRAQPWLRAKSLSLEAKGNTERHFEKQDLHLTWYYYYYDSGLGMSVLADDKARIIIGQYPGEFPFEPAGDIFVRKGYEALMEDHYLMSLLSAP